MCYNEERIELRSLEAMPEHIICAALEAKLSTGDKQIFASTISFKLQKSYIAALHRWNMWNSYSSFELLFLVCLY
jgi:hypothetical protein